MIHFLRKYSFTFLAIFILLSSYISSATRVEAQLGARCTYSGQCVNNQVCECIFGCDSPINAEYGPGDQDCGSSIIGGVEAPGNIASLNSASAVGAGTNGQGIGIIFFLSRLINFGAIVAGIIVMINFVIAGFTYVTMAGNTAAHQKVRERITWSMVGIVIIVSSYTIAGLIGLVFFKDAGYILSPQLEGAIN